jgi:hypothetical protein
VRVGVKAAMAKIRAESNGETMEQVKEWVQKAKETVSGRMYLSNHEEVSVELFLPETLPLTPRAATYIEDYSSKFTCTRWSCTVMWSKELIPTVASTQELMFPQKEHIFLLF